jgi:hypothetical protein
LRASGSISSSPRSINFHAQHSTELGALKQQIPPLREGMTSQREERLYDFEDSALGKAVKKE